MTAQIEACEKELHKLLKNLDNTRKSLVTAIEAMRKAKEAVNDLPKNCLSGNLETFLSSITKEIGLLRSSETPLETPPKSPEDNKTGNKSSENEANKIDSTQTEPAQELDVKVIKEEIKERVETVQKAEKDLKPPVSAETSGINDLPLWTDVKELDVLATSSLLADGCFWCKPVDSAAYRNTLKQISDDLRRHTLHDKSLWHCNTKNVNQLVCVLSKTHNLWLRAVIEKECTEHELVLRYVDIGKTEKMQRSRLNCVPDEMKQIQTLALKCCFEEQNIKVSYEMKWRFSDLTKSRLSMKIKNEIKESVLSRYVVSLVVPDDPVVDIGNIICGQLNADASLDASLPSKDVRFYSGQNENISMIRDVHNYDDKRKVDEKASNEEMKEVDKPIRSNEGSPKHTIHIDFGKDEDDERIDWAEVCQTPDVNDNNKEMEFPPLREYESESQDVKSEAEENIGETAGIEMRNDQDIKDEGIAGKETVKESGEKVVKDIEESTKAEDQGNAEELSVVKKSKGVKDVSDLDEDDAALENDALKEQCAVVDPAEEHDDTKAQKSIRDDGTVKQECVAEEHVGLENDSGSVEEHVAVADHNDVEQHESVEDYVDAKEQDSVKDNTATENKAVIEDDVAKEQNDAQEKEDLKETDHVTEDEAVKEPDNEKKDEAVKERYVEKEVAIEVRDNDKDDVSVKEEGSEKFNLDDDDDDSNVNSESDYIEEFQEVTESIHASIKQESEMILQKRLEDMKSGKQQKSSEASKNSECEGATETVDRPSIEYPEKTTSDENLSVTDGKLNVNFESKSVVQDFEDWDEEIQEQRKSSDNLADSNENKAYKFTEKTERQRWLDQQLNGLSHPSLIDPNAKYFFLVNSYKAIGKGFTTGRFTVPKALEEHLKNYKKYPIIILFYATRLSEDSIQDALRLCGVGIARSGPSKAAITNYKQVSLFDIELFCRAKTRRIPCTNDCTILCDELTRAEAYRRLKALDTMIRNGTVEDFDIPAFPDATANKTQQPQQQAPWLKNKPPRPHSRSNQSKSQHNSVPDSPQRSRDISFEPEELWSPVETQQPHSIQFDDVNNEQSHGSESLAAKRNLFKDTESEDNNVTRERTQSPVEENIQQQQPHTIQTSQCRSADKQQPEMTSQPQRQQQSKMLQAHHYRQQPAITHTRQQQQKPEMVQAHHYRQQPEMTHTRQQQQKPEMAQAHHYRQQPEMTHTQQQQQKPEMVQSQQQQQQPEQLVQGPFLAGNATQNLTQEQIQQIFYQYQMMLEGMPPIQNHPTQQNPQSQQQPQYGASMFRQPQFHQQSNSQHQSVLQQQPHYQPVMQSQFQPQSPTQPRFQQYPQSQQFFYPQQPQFPASSYQPSAFQNFAPPLQQHHADTALYSSRKLKSSKVAMKSGSVDDFGSDDEAERDMRKEYDIYNLNEHDL